MQGFSPGTNRITGAGIKPPWRLQASNAIFLGSCQRHLFPPTPRKIVCLPRMGKKRRCRTYPELVTVTKSVLWRKWSPIWSPKRWRSCLFQMYVTDYLLCTLACLVQDQECYICTPYFVGTMGIRHVDRDDRLPGSPYTTEYVHTWNQINWILICSSIIYRLLTIVRFRNIAE